MLCEVESLTVEKLSREPHSVPPSPYPNTISFPDYLNFMLEK